MTGVLIRAFAAADAAACAGVFDRAWHLGHPHAPRVIDAGIFETETKGERILVAESARDRVVAFVSLYEPDSFVHHLYVEPGSQGRGIGRALLERAVALAGGRASLKCQTQNARAFAFYQRLGWTEIAAGKGEFGAWIAMRSPD